MGEDVPPTSAPDPTRAIHDLSEVEIRDAEAKPREWIGRVLDARYRLSEPIGEGGFGFVFRAKHLILGRDVAVKILQSAAHADPVERARFDRESSMLAALSHPHIVGVTDFGVSEGVPYLVMELVEGRSLRAMLDQRELTAERALALVVQILKALAYAHEHGIVHRDLKPANVLVQRLGDDDHAKLLDFGFAKFFGALENKAGNELTAHGTAFGTAGYIAPEQLGSSTIDGRVDLYAASVLLFEMLAGRRPFQDPDTVHELRATLIEPPPSLVTLRPDLPLAPALDPILARGLAKDPAQRFESALEMMRALEPFLPAPRVSAAPAPSPPARRAPPMPSLPIIAAVIGAAALGLITIAGVIAGWAWSRSHDEPEPPPVATLPAPSFQIEHDTPLLGPPTGERPAPGDVWAPPLPPELAAIRTQLAAGETLRAPERRTLTRMIREQPWDARPHLLLAYSQRQERSLTAAIQSYERAYRASPASRGDEQMLTDLVVMAAHPTAGTRAAEAIATIYGSEAIPAVDRAIAVSIVDARAHGRLQALRDRLAAN
ncbi:serine/threonine-protein kinase [Sandaracinus amylolyticus]|uniref:Serine/threonine-protein kinase PknB n=1 Tax=Sandaracinus amylolyticus TaxID=927083 RepID=A0A0F6VZ21_9BACT|nr:serine/threonine-protein kinase [Sandaracinus amylolyticus]AKF03090.1 Serine/threonine-protein kinase PknB [Sandaracinus amylolyticus]